MAETAHALTEPLCAPAPNLLQGAAAALVLGRLKALRHGTLDVRLPDGSRRRFGLPSGSLQAELEVGSWQLFPRLVRGGDVGAGESYTAGEWSSPDLVGLTRLLLANEQLFEPSAVVGILGRMRDRCLNLARPS